jgi:enoyl-CoA hydratase
MEEPKFETIDIIRRGPVLTLAMNNGRRLNAIDGTLHEELARVFRFAAQDPESDVVILTGTGKGFTAGGDFDWFQQMVDEPALFEQTARDGKEIVFSLLDLEKPIIAKVNGPAAGLGASIALLCDVIFMADDAVILDPHVKAGLVAGDGGAVIWPQLIGYARAKHYLLTGDAVRAPEALEMGLVNFVVPREELDAAVDAYADRLAAGATRAIRWTKASVNIGLKQLAHSIMDACIAYEISTNVGEDHQEAIRAFKAKREPKFSGR